MLYPLTLSIHISSSSSSKALEESAYLVAENQVRFNFNFVTNMLKEEVWKNLF